MSVSQSARAIPRTLRVEVAARPGQASAAGRALVEAAQQLGILSLRACIADRLYFLHGQLTSDDVARLSHELLADPVTETFVVVPLDLPTSSPTEGEGEQALTAENLPPFPPDSARGRELGGESDEHRVEVTLLPGVTDPAAENLLRAAHLLGITGLERVATGQRFRLQGHLSDADLRRLAAEVLANPVVQRFEIDRAID